MTPFELGLVLASALLHAGWSVAIKGSGDPLTFNLLQEVGPAVALAVALPFVDVAEIPAGVWGLLAATGVAHGLYFYWMSRAYGEGDLTLVYPIARATPAILPLFAAPVLGETISLWGGLGIATVVAGMWLVHGVGLSRRGFGGRAAGFAYLTLAATVAFSLLDKRAMEELAPLPWSSALPRALFFCLLIYAASAPPFLLLGLRRVRPRALVRAARSQLAPATAAAAASLVGYGLILQALQTAPVSYVVAVRQTSVLFALLLGVLWLRERPGRPRTLGALAITLGVALVALA